MYIYIYIYIHIYIYIRMHEIFGVPKKDSSLMFLDVSCATKQVGFEALMNRFRSLLVVEEWGLKLRTGYL